LRLLWEKFTLYVFLDCYLLASVYAILAVINYEEASPKRAFTESLRKVGKRVS